jgi:hypothetical protein
MAAAFVWDMAALAAVDSDMAALDTDMAAALVEVITMVAVVSISDSKLTFIKTSMS